jgi:putative hemolysin
MNFIGFDVLIVVFLILLNGVLSMSEIAIISARRPRLQQWSEDGNKRARQALDLANSPNQLLSTVQIGITFVGVVSGAFAGKNLAIEVERYLRSFEILTSYAESLGFGVVVLGITFLSLVLGELVPKRIALNSPERVASLVAAPMRILASVVSPVVGLLSGSTDLILRIVGVRPSTDPPITEEEIRLLIKQGTVAGVFEEAEQEMLHRVLRLGERRVGVAMTPRGRVEWLDLNESSQRLRRKISKSVYSRFPVCQGRLNNLLGVVFVRDLLARTLKGGEFDIRACLRQPLVVHEGMHLLNVMERFKESGMEFALVVDEYGTIEGVVTLNDILEAIVGDIPSLDEVGEPPVIRREDGSLLVDGMLPVDELKELLLVKYLPGEKAGHYQTLGGFVVTYLKKIPLSGDHFVCGGFRFEVVDMDRHRVDKVLIQRCVPTEDDACSGSEED